MPKESASDYNLDEIKFHWKKWKDESRGFGAEQFSARQS